MTLTKILGSFLQPIVAEHDDQTERGKGQQFKGMCHKALHRTKPRGKGLRQH